MTATAFIAREEIFPHPHNKMWGKPASSPEAMKRAIAITGDMEPLRVCAFPGGFHIISGHSRFEASTDNPIECKLLEGLSEEEQVLRLITYNAGHAADKGKLLRAAEYCRRHFPAISIERILGAAMVIEDREKWATALEAATKAIEKVGKGNKARSLKNFEEAASSGLEAIEDAVVKSTRKAGTEVAQGKNSSSLFEQKNCDKPLPSNEMRENTSQKSDEEDVPKTPISESASTQNSCSENSTEKRSAGIPEVSAMPESKMLATANSLNRTMREAGMLSSIQADFAMKTILTLLRGESLPEPPSKAVIERLNKQIARLQKDLETERLVANDNGHSMNAAVDVVNSLFRKSIAAFIKDRPRDGILSINARHLHAELTAINFQGLDSLDPETLQARQDEATRQDP